MNHEAEQEIAKALEAADLSGAATRAIRAYGGEILEYLQVVMKNARDADDAFSAFAENLWKGIGAFRGECRMRTWAYRLAWNAAHDFHRDAFRRRARRLRTSEATRLADEVRASTPMHHRSDARRWLNEVKATLEPDDRSLLLLRVERGLSWDEVAQVMVEAGDPVESAALKKRFERLKTRLRELARAHGIAVR